METTEKPSATPFDFDWGDIAACHRDRHADLLEVEVKNGTESFCPRCGVVVKRHEELLLGRRQTSQKARGMEG